MCVCIKRLINSTFLWRGLRGCPVTELHVDHSSTIIANPLWLNLCVVVVIHSGFFALDSEVQGKIQKGSTVLGEWFLQT